MTPYSLRFLKKMLSLGDAAMISLDRELLQAIITPFSRHLPFIAIYHHFGLFCTICACLRANSAPSLLVLIKTFSLGAVAAIPVKRKLTQAITTPLSQH